MDTSHSELVLPCVSGAPTSRQIHILLVNPNSTEYMTKQCLDAIASSLPSDVTVHGFTARHPGPTAIESQTDAVLSTEACIRQIKPIADKYDGFLVACFRAHPLIAVLKEELEAPVLGIMEAAMYASRMIGESMGIICTSDRSMMVHKRAVSSYGFSDFFSGCESVQLGVLELDSKPKEEVQAIVSQKIDTLIQEKHADCILLGCAGMAEMRAFCEAAVDGTGVRVIDGVGIGIQFLLSLIKENLRTAKSGIYRETIVDRLRRKQDWF